MSKWAYVAGTVEVEPGGESQRVSDFILGEALDHLPEVTGSEGPMDVHVAMRKGADCSSTHDEFGQPSNLSERGWFKRQTAYLLTLDGRLRDRDIVRTRRELAKWLCRLSKRVRVRGVLVRVWDCYGGSSLIDAPDGGAWRDMFERPGRSHWEDIDTRRSTGYRYGILPESTWRERLFTLLPDGNATARTLDMMLGNLQGFEYGDVDLSVMEDLSAEVENTLDWARMLETVKNDSK